MSYSRENKSNAAQPSEDPNVSDSRIKKQLLSQSSQVNSAQATTPEILRYFNQNKLNSLEEFKEILKRVATTHFYQGEKPTVNWTHNIDDNTLPLLIQAKINNAVKIAFENYLMMCRYFSDKDVLILQENDSRDKLKVGVVAYLAFYRNGELLGKGWPWSEFSKDAACICFKDKDGNSVFHIRGTLQTSTGRNFPEFFSNPVSPLEQSVISSNTELMNCIASSDLKAAIKLIQQNDAINLYSYTYGSSPLILAISKGWNHEDSEPSRRSKDPNDPNRYPQRVIINELFKHKHLDVNCIHLANGITPLHLACARGDSPELIRELIARGADITAKDCHGKTPRDLLGMTSAEADQLVKSIGVWCTLPNEQERKSNAIEIEKIFLSVEKDDVHFAFHR